MICTNGTNCTTSCVNDYSCYNLNFIVQTNSELRLYCNSSAIRPCYYQNYYIYGKFFLTCVSSACHYSNFYVYSGGFLYLDNAQNGYYDISNIYLYKC